MNCNHYGRDGDVVADCDRDGDGHGHAAAMALIVCQTSLHMCVCVDICAHVRMESAVASISAWIYHERCFAWSTCLNRCIFLSLKPLQT